MRNPTQLWNLFKRWMFVFSAALFCNACGNDEPDTDNEATVLNPSSRFSSCNAALSECTNGNGNYCLFGFKWGENPLFSPAGYNSQGPETAGGTLSFSFQEENGMIDTHAQIDLPSESFATLPSCAKSEIRRALQAWATVTNIEFQELPENSTADIRFFVADIRQGGIGYPNYPSAPCTAFSGNVVIQSGLAFDDCTTFGDFIIHETGHVLGLGHVESNNIMNPDFLSLGISGLQDGDIRGIHELYGQ